MLTRTQALEGGANVTCISKVRFTYRSYSSGLGHYATRRPDCMADNPPDPH